MTEDNIIAAFPGLRNDTFFKITSPDDRCYNCIAWAYSFYKDRWMQFDTTPKLDGVWYWWPPGVTVDSGVEAYVEAFKTRGFVVCENGDLEEGYIKIALYGKRSIDGKVECTHAARQRRNGMWTSKLGSKNDIQHGTPYTIEGTCYGKVIENVI